MVETISPVVHGGRARWLGTLALHALGATGTAAIFGAALGSLGAALGAPWQRPGLFALAWVSGLYALNALVFLALIGVWALVAPGAGGAGLVHQTWPPFWTASALPAVAHRSRRSSRRRRSSSNAGAVVVAMKSVRAGE